MKYDANSGNLRTMTNSLPEEPEVRRFRLADYTKTRANLRESGQGRRRMRGSGNGDLQTAAKQAANRRRRLQVQRRTSDDHQHKPAFTDDDDLILFHLRRQHVRFPNVETIVIDDDLVSDSESRSENCSYLPVGTMNPTFATHSPSKKASRESFPYRKFHSDDETASQSSTSLTASLSQHSISVSQLEVKSVPPNSQLNQSPRQSSLQSITSSQLSNSMHQRSSLHSQSTSNRNPDSIVLDLHMQSPLSNKQKLLRESSFSSRGSFGHSITSVSRSSWQPHTPISSRSPKPVHTPSSLKKVLQLHTPTSSGKGVLESDDCSRHSASSQGRKKLVMKNVNNIRLDDYFKQEKKKRDSTCSKSHSKKSSKKTSLNLHKVDLDLSEHTPFSKFIKPTTVPETPTTACCTPSSRTAGLRSFSSSDGGNSLLKEMQRCVRSNLSFGLEDSESSSRSAMRSFSSSDGGINILKEMHRSLRLGPYQNTEESDTDCDDTSASDTSALLIMQKELRSTRNLLRTKSNDSLTKTRRSPKNLQRNKSDSTSLDALKRMMNEKERKTVLDGNEHATEGITKPGTDPLKQTRGGFLMQPQHGSTAPKRNIPKSMLFCPFEPVPAKLGTTKPNAPSSLHHETVKDNNQISRQGPPENGLIPTSVNVTSVSPKPSPGKAKTRRLPGTTYLNSTQYLSTEELRFR